MICKACKKSIDDESIYCKWCGSRQVRERKKKQSATVPKPTQLKSGEWSGQIMVDGVRHRIKAKSEKEFYALASGIKTGMVELAERPADMTVGDAITAYISGKANRLQETTKQTYDYIRRCRFSELMNTKLKDINSDVVDAAIEAELDKPSRKGGTIKPKTVIDAYHLVATVLQKYIKNFDLDVTLPELQRSLVVVIPPEEIYPVIKDTDIELPCLLAMWLGMSMSEILGLTKSGSINGNKLYINETVVTLRSGQYRKDLAKEEHRKRVYDIPPHIMKLINAVEGDVIETRTGHAIYMRFQTELRNAGLPPMKFHALRHVNASVMAEEQIPTQTAQDRNGWKTDNTMKNVYIHTFDKSRLAADAVIDARFEAIINAGKPQEKQPETT